MSLNATDFGSGMLLGGCLTELHVSISWGWLTLFRLK